VKKEPEAHRQGDFRLLGCDLVDRECFISALTSCGGFPDVFGNSELSRAGLLMDFGRAVEVQQNFVRCIRKKATQIATFGRSFAWPAER